MCTQCPSLCHTPHSKTTHKYKCAGSKAAFKLSVGLKGNSRDCIQLVDAIEQNVE